MKKKFISVLLSLCMALSLLPVSALAANWNPDDKITITVRVFDQSTGDYYVVGTDTCTKGDQYIQSDAYKIPRLTQFVDSSKFGSVVKVVGNWYFPSGDSSQGATVYWSCNSNTATMTYWITSYNPAGSSGGGTTEDSGSIPSNAVWKFYLKYDLAGGTNSSSFPTQAYGATNKYEKSHTFATHSVTPIREGYVFKEWRQSGSVSTTRQLGADCLVSATGISGYNGGTVTDTLTAVWEKVESSPATSVTLTYKSSDGTTILDTKTCFAGDSVTVADYSSNWAKNEGYTFKGWATSANSSTVAYAAGDTFTIEADTTLYAVWEKDAVEAAPTKTTTQLVVFKKISNYQTLGGNITPSMLPDDFKMTVTVTNQAANYNKTVEFTKTSAVETTDTYVGSLQWTLDDVPLYTSYGIDDFAWDEANLAKYGTKVTVVETNYELAGYTCKSTAYLNGDVGVPNEVKNGTNTYTFYLGDAANRSTSQIGIQNTYNAKPYTVSYTDGVADGVIFEDQVYSQCYAGTATPKFKVNGIEVTPTREGYVFAGWNPTVAVTVTADVTYTAQWTPLDVITLEPVSITSYVGGTSMSGNATPTLRWLVTLPNGVELEKNEDNVPKISTLTMVMHTINADGSENTREMTPRLIEDSNPDSGDHAFYYYFPTLESGLSFDTEKDLEGDFLTLTDVSAVQGRAGRYKISLVQEPAWYITATVGEQTYSVEVNIPENVQITTRYVSDESTMYDSPSSMLTKVVTTSDEVDTSKGKAVAVISKDATFYTNGKESGLGLIGADGNTGGTFGGSEPLIALLFDDTVTLVNTNNEQLENKKLEELMITHAGHASDYGSETDYSFDGWKYDFRYLDLVNVNDGNAWVSCDKDITIYWPYPDGVSSSGYEFQLLHYKYMDRDVDYGISLVGNVVEWTEQFMHGENKDAEATVVEEIGVTATDEGLMFTLEADASGDNMSPFVLMWKAKTSSGDNPGGGTTYYPLHYESNGGTEYKDERYASGTTVSLDKVPTREGHVFTGWYADEALTEKITSIKMASNKTVYAGWRASAVPDMLNGDDHFAYVIGYTDGTVRPLANISRAEVATIFFRLLTAEVRDGNLTSTNTFEDVTEDMWYNTPISTMAKLSIVTGRIETTFDPDAPITRAEFAAICARFDTGLTNGDSDFTDISGHWAEAEIERAASLGWIMGYPDGTFLPNQYITRAEAMTIINRVLCRIPEDESGLLDGMNIWPDNNSGDWYYLAVQEATNSHEYVHKGEIYETWAKLTEDPDWKRYGN